MLLNIFLNTWQGGNKGGDKGGVCYICARNSYSNTKFLAPSINTEEYSFFVTVHNDLSMALGGRGG